MLSNCVVLCTFVNNRQNTWSNYCDFFYTNYRKVCNLFCAQQVVSKHMKKYLLFCNWSQIYWIRSKIYCFCCLYFIVYTIAQFAFHPHPTQKAYQNLTKCCNVSIAPYYGHETDCSIRSETLLYSLFFSNSLNSFTYFYFILETNLYWPL